MTNEAVAASARLGVVIVNYNSGPLLSRCLEQLSLQVPVASQIVVVDNGSEDGSFKRLPFYNNVQVVEAKENLGFAAANNLALDYLRDIELVMTLNPDAFVQSGCLQALCDAAENYPEFDSFACRMMRDAATVDGAGDCYHVSGLVWRHLHGAELSSKALEENEVFSPCAGAALYRYSALVQLGGFDENFFCYVEDVDLGYRLRLAGKRCLYVPNAEVVHLGSAISDKYPGFAIYHGHRNLTWVFVKNTPLPLLILMLPLHLLMIVFLYFVYIRRGCGRVYLKAKFDALLGVPRVWGQRSLVLGARRISLWALIKSYRFSFFRK